MKDDLEFVITKVDGETRKIPTFVVLEKVCANSKAIRFV